MQIMNTGMGSDTVGLHKSIEYNADILHRIKQAMKYMLSTNPNSVQKDFIELFLARNIEFRPYERYVGILYSMLKYSMGPSRPPTVHNMIKMEGGALVGPAGSTPGMDQVMYKTVRNTPFGRALIKSLVGDSIDTNLYLISDFGMRVLKSNHKSPQRIFFTIEDSPDPIFNTILNISMYDNSSKLFMPIAHCLMTNRQTQHFQVTISWFQRELGAFLKPSIIITDFNFDLFHSIHTLYPTTPAFTSLTSFLLHIWTTAQSTHLPLTPKPLSFLSQIPKLLLETPENTKTEFLKLVEKTLPTPHIQDFSAIYSKIFTDQEGWYNLAPLASGYKNIFINSAKSQEMQRKIWMKYGQLGALEAVKRFEGDV